MYAKRVSTIHSIFSRWMSQGWVRPPQISGDFLQHVYREYNRQADRGATQALEGRPHNIMFSGARRDVLQTYKNFLIEFDGGARDHRASSCWILKGSNRATETTSDPRWTRIASRSFCLAEGPRDPITAVNAELAAVENAVLCFDVLISRHLGRVTIDSD